MYNSILKYNIIIIKYTFNIQFKKRYLLLINEKFHFINSLLKKVLLF